MAWVAESLKSIESVKVGMTRADLLKVFQTEGGLSTRLQRTYVYRECGYFKVVVEFEAVGGPPHDSRGAVAPEESAQDVIKNISRPYIQLTISD